MRKTLMLLALALSPGCFGNPLITTNKCELSSKAAPLPRVPPFILNELRSAGAQRFKVEVAADGHVRKLAVSVRKDALPGWVHELADRELEGGQDREYEIEVYDDGAHVYEVKRVVGGKEVELSVHTARTIRYIKRQVDIGTLPEKVSEAASTARLSAESAVLEERGAAKQYHLRGKLGGAPCGLVLDERGKVLRRSCTLDARVEIDL